MVTRVTRNRFFAPVKGVKISGVTLPKRGSKHSAGYDFYATEDIYCPAHGLSKLSFTNVKVFMPWNEYLAIMIRSSLAVKHGLQVAQGTAIIDADYANNPDNDGNIGIAIVNNSNEDYVIKKGERFCQGVFHQYEITIDDNADGERNGGYGSSGKF